MSKIAFWNNKGGTGKTSLAFQAICAKAQESPGAKVLAVDLCPQANLSELFLGGLEGDGGIKLEGLHNGKHRQSIGGYFQERMPSPFAVPNLNPAIYIVQPHAFNSDIPQNIDLVPGDGLVELQANAITTLANTQIPGTNTWLAVIDWLRDFLQAVGEYDYVYVDTNPSFSIYTQIALSSVDSMILPVMADDSSRRAVRNVFGLVHQINLPNPIYATHTFANKLATAGRMPPQVQLLAKNRLTQYMGPASAYSNVLTSIDNMVNVLLNTHPGIFTFNNISNGTVDIRDFGSTGVVAFAFGRPFFTMNSGSYNVQGRDVQVKREYLDHCIQAINDLAVHM